MTLTGGGKPIHFSTMRVLFMGMSGILSRTPLAILLSGGVNVCGVALPAATLPPYVLPINGRSLIPSQPNSIPLTANPGMLPLAAQHKLPVYPVRRLGDEEMVAALTAVQPDLICVSCFDQIVPPAILNLPRFGCLNLHPSLLPHFRGPSPLFWTLHAGQKETGVTVHFMDEGLDSGDIALQSGVTLPDGLSGAQVEQMTAERGGRLLLTAVKQLATGYLPRQPQPLGGSYQSSPQAEDFRLDTNWSAQRAFNFMRGTQEWARPYPVNVAGEEVWLRTAVACHPRQAQSRPFIRQSKAVSIQFSPGVLVAQP
ncbi:MAG: hypothetical protein GY796_27600 [Chloroflexi bacterium]|nr:hypothetical protein [Chloroflexota bacterium]